MRIRLGYRQAARVVRRRATNFYFAFLGQRPPARRALHAIYAFCRAADDAADDGRDELEARRSLDQLGSRLAEVYAGRPEAPLDHALADAVGRFGIRRRDFESVLRGVRRDLTVRRYASFDELYVYCFEVASSVGLLCLPIFGRDDALARRHAIDLGVGMQLTNILRDLREDARRERVYVPLADLRRFGLDEADLTPPFAGRRPGVPGTSENGEWLPPGRGRIRTGEWDRLVRFETARARRFLASGARLLSLLAPRERFCPWMMVSMYGRILERIEDLGAGALERRVTLSGGRKLWLAARGVTIAAGSSPKPAGWTRPKARGERDSRRPNRTRPQNKNAEGRPRRIRNPLDHPRA